MKFKACAWPLALPNSVTATLQGEMFTGLRHPVLLTAVLGSRYGTPRIFALGSESVRWHPSREAAVHILGMKP